MNKLIQSLLATALAVGLFSAAFGQVSINSNTFSYSENFNTWLGTEVTIPANWTLSAAGTIEFRGTGTGTGSAGGFWAFGSTDSWALGELRSNATDNLTFGVEFVNNTGNTITDISLNWDYEQWRYANTSGLVLAGTGALSSVDFSSHGITASATGTNGTVTVTPTTVTLTGLNISDEATMGLFWTTVNAAGANSALAINNFEASFTAVPEPATYGAIFGALALGLAMVRRRVNR
jgi:hypothetical protein